MGQDSGGLPHYTAELANAVAKSHDVTVMKPSETTADSIFSDAVTTINSFEPTEISQQNIFNLNLNVRKNLRGLLSYRNLKQIEEIDPDIIHDPTDEFPQVNLFAYLTGVYEDYPYVITKHEVKHGGASPLLQIADFVISAVPDFQKQSAVVHSDRQKNTLENQGRNIESVKVISHGVYTLFNDLDYTERPEEENHILFFGSIVPPKGLEFLIKAVPDIAAELPDFTLTIAGKGSIPEGCEQILNKYDSNVNLRNEFIPNEEVGELFTRAQLVVLPYRDGWQTGHSGTLSVAFAFGKPVITSRVGDFPEMVDESGAGETVEPESQEALSRAIIRVLNDDEKRKRMSSASERMAERLSWENVGQMHIDLYRDVIDTS